VSIRTRQNNSSKMDFRSPFLCPEMFQNDAYRKICKFVYLPECVSCSLNLDTETVASSINCALLFESIRWHPTLLSDYRARMCTRCAHRYVALDRNAFGT
jgi:hypothetical protein